MSHHRQVLFECDYRGVIPISTAVYSVLKSADPSQPLAIHLINDRAFIDGDGAARVREIVARFPFATVEFHDFTPFEEKYGEVLDEKPSRWPPITWGFLFAAEVMPEVTGNIVFLDWDTFVFKDLGELFDLDLESEKLVAAAVSEATREERPDLVRCEWPVECGPSINVGVTVINLDAFRRERVVHTVMEWWTKYKGKTECAEQDAFNATFGTRIKRLHPRWNHFAGWGERPIRMNPFRRFWRSNPPRLVLQAVVDPGIVHFIAGRKPWKYNHSPYRNHYRRAMIELGIIQHDLPGETGKKKWIEGPLFDFYHWLIRLYCKTLLATFFRSR